KGLGRAGSEIAICDIVNTEKVVEQLRKEGIKTKGYYIDVMDINKIKACHDEVMKDSGRIDILLNAAGGNIKEATTSRDLSFFDIPLSDIWENYVKKQGWGFHHKYILDKFFSPLNQNSRVFCCQSCC
ncbi:unnamed protein product, partial [marine sediment metagenome]